MANEKRVMKNCPKCKTNLDGELIYKSFRDLGYNVSTAKERAEMYGATKTKGRWNRAIGIYDRAQDRTCAYECPECQHRWPA
jgi:hypothetical protein